jgi:predicted amidohydrolase
VFAVTIRVAAIQLGLHQSSYEDVIDNALSMVKEAAESDVNIACLPEHWLIEYQDRVGESVAQLSKAAEDYGIWLVTGANYTREANTTFVESALLAPDGSIVGRQRKIHLFGDERAHAVAGSEYNVFEAGGYKAGIVICYDNVFPEVSRILALKGAEILFVPSRIRAEGVDPWLLYLRVRALENRIPIVAPNIFRPPRYLGGSVIVDVKEDRASGVVLPEVKALAKHDDQIVVADVDLEKARQLRRARFAARRPETYKELIA